MSAKHNSGSVLFVCLGNICRSPIAEAVFAHLLRERGLDSRWTTDSAATSNWHIGGRADERGQELMRKKKVERDHIVRQVTVDDFHHFDFIFAMDESNIRNLDRVRPKDGRAVIQLLGEFDPEGVRIVEDPYYGDEKDFEAVYDQCMRCCKAFLDKHAA